MAEEKLTEEQVKDELTPEELASAKSFGLIAEVEEEKEEVKEEIEDTSEEEVEKELEEEVVEEEKEEVEEKKEEEEVEEKEEVKEEDEKTLEHSSDLDEKFESMSDNPQQEHEELSNFNKTQKAFYWKWKNTNMKRKEAVAKAELQEVRIKALEDKLGNVDTKKDEVDSILDEVEGQKPMTRAEYIAEEQAKQANAQKSAIVKKRLVESGKKASSMHDDFKDVAALAQELLKGDKSGHYYQLFFAEAEKADGDPAEFIYKLGKSHPKYEVNKSIKSGGGQAAKKILKQKRQSSASLGSSTDTKKKGGKLDPENITLEQASGLSQSDWNKLPQTARDRLLQM